MKIPGTQLRQIIRNVLIESYSKYIEDYPEELNYSKCMDTAMKFWDEGEHWTMEDADTWLNERQGGDLDTGHRYEIVGPDKVRTTTYAGEEVYLTAEEACNFNPEG